MPDRQAHPRNTAGLSQSVWSPDELELVSLAWEKHGGYDSIPTIERLYDRTSTGAYCCCDPGCPFVRRSAVAMWKHIHTAHGRSDLPPADFDWGSYV